MEEEAEHPIKRSKTGESEIKDRKELFRDTAKRFQSDSSHKTFDTRYFTLYHNVFSVQDTSLLKRSRTHITDNNLLGVTCYCNFRGL